MTDAAMTARYAAAELVEKLLNEIELVTTSTGSYNVDFGSKWIGGVENRMKELYVPGGSASSDGALQLLNKGTNLSVIKSTDMHTPSSVLKNVQGHGHRRSRQRKQHAGDHHAR